MRVLGYISFGMTFAKFILGIFTTSYITTGQYTTPNIVILVTLIIFLDVFDGILFRKSGLACHRIRRILDSATDKIVVSLVVIATMFTTGRFFYLGIILLVEATIAIISLSAYLHGQLIKPSLSGKLSLLFLAGLCVTELTVAKRLLSTTLFLATIGLGLLAIKDYAKQYYDS